MARYKIFSTALEVAALARMEREINEWMERERPRILHMAQSANVRATGTSLADVVVSFVYDSGGIDSLGTTTATASTSVPDVFDRTLEDADLDPNADEDDVLLPEAELPY